MGWDKDRPVGTRSFKVGDDAIRENFAYIENALKDRIEFGPGSTNDGREKTTISETLPASPKAGYHALNPTIPGLHYYDGTATRSLYGIPIGAILSWTGSVSAVPDGWWQCCPFHATLAPKGAAGVEKNGIIVPHLESRFLVGLDPTDSDYDGIGETGGSIEHVVEQANIEQFPATPTQAWTGGGFVNVLQSLVTRVVAEPVLEDILIGTVGATPIDHRPPFYTICYIIFCAV